MITNISTLQILTSHNKPRAKQVFKYSTMAITQGNYLQRDSYP